MADELAVSTSGLRVAAKDSDVLAAGLAAGVTARGVGDHSSVAGLNSLDAAVGSVRGRQSKRMSRQADDLSSGSARYDDTDGGAADDIAFTV